MEKLTAVFMSLLTTLSLFLGCAGSGDYERSTGLKAAIDALINKNEIVSEKYIGEASDYTWKESDAYSLDDTFILKKEKDRDFVILNITDTHFSDYDYRAFTAFDVEMKIKALVSSVKPDLITVSGDIVCTDSTRYATGRITDLFESFGIPWAPMFGNHDYEGNCDKNYLADIMMSAPNCLMKKGDPDMGVGNYIINIAEDNGDGSSDIVETLVIMDCRAPDRKKQIEWFKWVAENTNRITENSSEISVFTHIPLIEYQYAYDAAWDTENNCWKDGFNAYGEWNERICYDSNPDGTASLDGLFSAMKESGTTKFFFCGHEHLNNFSIEYEGIRLTYCLKVGIASGSKFMFSGGTEIRVGENGINRILHKSLALGPVITLEDIPAK